VVTYLERNLPAFSTTVTPEQEAEYNDFKRALEKEVKLVRSRTECIRYLVRFTEYFPDNHTKIRVPKQTQFDVDNPEGRKAFLASEAVRQREYISLRPEHRVPSTDLDQITGLYRTADSLYTVAVIPSKTSFREYVGVIVESRSPWWIPGQVKFELAQKGPHVYEGFFYSALHELSYRTVVPFQNGVIGNHWFNTTRSHTVDHSTNPGRAIELEVDPCITYLRIPSFGGEYTRELDSLYVRLAPVIAEVPYLLIDVRDNGGGSTFNALPLLQWLYTQPIPDDNRSELYATPDILHLYEAQFKEIMQDSTQVDGDTRQAFRSIIADLHQAEPNAFVPDSEPVDTIFGEALPSPKKVAILYNRGCASACEDLLFLAQYSEKTTLVGENSGGFVGYGNMFTVYTPCYGLGLSMSTTRYPSKLNVEVSGIEPDVYLDYNRDWIEQARDLLQH